MQLLAALACVDYLTVFSENTPWALITWLQPDILVKGGDYPPETVVGCQEAGTYGGRVLCLMCTGYRPPRSHRVHCQTRRLGLYRRLEILRLMVLITQPVLLQQMIDPRCI